MSIFLLQQKVRLFKDAGIILIRPSIGRVVTNGKQIFAWKLLKCGQKHILVAYLCPEDGGLSA